MSAAVWVFRNLTELVDSSASCRIHDLSDQGRKTELTEWIINQPTCSNVVADTGQARDYAGEEFRGESSRLDVMAHD